MAIPGNVPPAEALLPPIEVPVIAHFGAYDVIAFDLVDGAEFVWTDRLEQATGA